MRGSRIKRGLVVAQVPYLGFQWFALIEASSQAMWEIAGSVSQPEMPSSTGDDTLAARLAEAQPGSVDAALLTAAAAAVRESSALDKQLKRAREVSYADCLCLCMSTVLVKALCCTAALVLAGE